MELGYPWTVSILNIWSGLCSVAAACLRLHYSSFRPQSHDGRKATSTFHSPSIHRSTRRSIMRCQVPFFIFYSRRKLGLGIRGGRTRRRRARSHSISPLSLSPSLPAKVRLRLRWRPIQFASRDESSILTERRMDGWITVGGGGWEEERRQKKRVDGWRE